MSWIVATLLSAVVLGFYDIAKKHAVARNAVMPTLLLATLAGSAAFVALTLLRGDLQTVTAGAPRDFLLIALKSVLVSGSWICVYAAMQTMPISLAAPIRATSPVWTFLGALLLYHELPSPMQAIGMATIFIGYFLFATLGKLEGFSWRSRGMTLILAGTLLGAASSLYDKFLLNSLHLNPTFVQFHFSLGLVVVLGLASAVRKEGRQLVGVEAGEAQVEGLLLQCLDLDGQQVLVPSRVQSRAVDGEDVRLLL